MKVIQPQWLKSGGQMSPGFVPKMTKGTTSGGVGNPVIDGFDQSVYDDELDQVFIRDMQKAKTLEEKQALIQRYHDLAGNAYDLLRDIGYDDAASKDSAIKDTRGGKQKSPTFNYQRAYHAAGFHTPHFTSGFKVGNYTPVEGGTGDNHYSSNNTKFMGDDIYGRITFHRVYNRFTDEQLARHNASAKEYGFQWVPDERGASDPRQKDGYKFYRLELISNPGQEVTEEDIINRGAEEIIQDNASSN